MKEIVTDIPLYIDSDTNPLLEGGYEPIGTEINATDMEVIGTLPADIDGVYVRNGPNPQFQPRGRYHIFDGDGMLHAMQLKDGKAVYKNRWTKTRALEMEREAGKALWPGLLEMPDRTLPEMWGSDDNLKDVANTDVVPFGGKVLCMFYQCGEPYLVDPITLETESIIDMDAMDARLISAHSRTDLHTGEFYFFDYHTKPPYMTYGVLNPDGTKKHFTEIDLPAARLPHDMGITDNYVILHDLPLYWDPELLKRDIHKVCFFPENPSRFGVLPRLGTNEDIQWFEAEPGYIYHVINSWEEGDEIVHDVCRMQTPCPPDDARIGDTKYASLLAWGAMDAQYYRYRFNLKTGETTEGVIDDQCVEFPTINQYFQGKKNKYSYCVFIPQGEPLRMGGIIRYETDTGNRTEYMYDKNVYASEPVFAPRIGATEEDDGYVMTFVEDMNQDGRTELHIFDPHKIDQGPICRVVIPQRIPMGFHACWVPGETIKN
ncbi:carotenoid cleavage dioxygenase [Kordiimonas sediminis]|uniref:Dioxygenase n=1 Tax=Kordiimonas sediminis TaxID=1735581 RepID=A0A919ANT6_9PROT|nr:carotenoid oxygenase family protein [Kordiimonas sediminis]GHF17558.1 carotenoid cleavage dioxygenase [Kordiimonas sediminis]